MEMGEIVIQNVNQVYHNANQGDFNALSDINLHLCKGESLAIEGESGSGKSTLARLLIGIDLPISYSKDLVVYNSSKIAGYTFSSVPQFFEIDNVQPAE